MASIVGYACFGFAARFMQLAIQRRPHIAQVELPAYALYGSVAIGAGLWLDNVEERQMKILAEKKVQLLEKRRRRQELEAAAAAGAS